LWKRWQVKATEKQTGEREKQNIPKFHPLLPEGRGRQEAKDTVRG
jgi:hypothetical protein